MRKILCAFIFLSISIAYTAVYAQEKEKLTISTYYPGPNAVYRTIRLKPAATPPGNDSGQIFYDSGNDTIKYCDSTGKWISLMGGAAAQDKWELTPYNTFPGTPRRGDIFFNNTTNTVQLYNMTDKWYSITADSGFWQESYISGQYNLITTNHNATLRKLMIGTGEYAACSVMHRTTSGADEEGRVASFTKHLQGKGTQELLFSLFPSGSVNSYLNQTSVLSVPYGNLKIAVLNTTRALDFSVGNWWNHNGDVLFFSNPTGETYPSNYTVTVGNNTTQFPLAVDSDDAALTKWCSNSTFAVRGVYNNTKTGIFNVISFYTDADLMYGNTVENGANYVDPYKLSNGTANHYYAKFVHDSKGNAAWWCGNSITGKTAIPLGTSVADSGWNVAWKVQLWNKDGQMTCPSSRKIKENFAPVDPDDILQRIDQLDVSRWNYKSQGKSDMHIGPVAEDFYRIFKIGDAEDQLSPQDEIGVSLAGLKGISKKAREQQNQLDELQSRVAALKSRMNGSR